MTQSPYTVTISGYEYNIDKVCNAFIVAYYYGSITHMVMIQRRLCDYTMWVSLKIRSHRMFMFSVRLLLLANEEKLLKQFLETYGENTNNINPELFTMTNPEKGSTSKKRYLTFQRMKRYSYPQNWADYPCIVL